MKRTADELRQLRSEADGWLAIKAVIYLLQCTIIGMIKMLRRGKKSYEELVDQCDEDWLNSNVHEDNETFIDSESETDDPVGGDEGVVSDDDFDEVKPDGGDYLD